MTAKQRIDSLKLIESQKSPSSMASRQLQHSSSPVHDLDLPELDSNTRIAAIALMIEPLENQLEQLRTENREKDREIEKMYSELARERLERERILAERVDSRQSDDLD